MSISNILSWFYPLSPIFFISKLPNINIINNIRSIFNLTTSAKITHTNTKNLPNYNSLNEVSKTIYSIIKQKPINLTLNYKTSQQEVYLPQLPIGMYGVPQNNVYANRLHKNGKLERLEWFLKRDLQTTINQCPKEENLLSNNNLLKLSQPLGLQALYNISVKRVELEPDNKEEFLTKLEEIISSLFNHPIEQRIDLLIENIIKLAQNHKLYARCKIVEQLQPPALVKVLNIKSIDKNEPEPQKAMACFVEVDISPLTKLHGKICAGQTAVGLILNQKEHADLRQELKQTYEKYSQKPTLNLEQELSTNNYQLLAQAKPRIYSIMGENSNDFHKSLTFMVRNAGSGTYFCNSKVGDIMALGLTLSNKFTCPKAEIPMIFIAFGTAASPCIHMLRTRYKNALEQGIICAPTLIMLSHKNKTLAYGLDIIKSLAADPRNNITLINVYSEKTSNKAHTHLFPKGEQDMHLGHDIVHDPKHFSTIFNFMCIPNIHVRTAGYAGMEDKFMQGLLDMCDTLENKEYIKQELTSRYNHIKARDAIQAEGSHAKDAPQK